MFNLTPYIYNIVSIYTHKKNYKLNTMIDPTCIDNPNDSIYILLYLHGC